MANRHMKRCSTSLVTREMQIKTTMRSCFTHTIMLIIKKIDNNKCWYGGCEVIGMQIRSWWKCKMVQPL